MYVKSKEKTTTELPKLKRNKVLNTWDRANIIKKILHGRERAYLGFTKRLFRIALNNPAEPFDKT